MSLSLQRARVHASLAGVLIALVALLPAAPARAASMTCSSHPAPSISARAGVITGHFYFSCNTIAGVDHIFASTFFRRHDGYIVDGSSSNYYQKSAAWTDGFAVGSQHGTWTAVEILHIYTYGVFHAPGCGRVAGNEVMCRWESAPVFG
jgi:hypothetical protein